MSIFTNDPRLAAALARIDQAFVAFKRCRTSAELWKECEEACDDYWRVFDEVHADRAARRAKRNA